MAERWQELAPTSQVKPGTYRLRGTFRGPYNRLTTGMAHTFVGAQLATKGLKLVRFDHAAPLMSAHASGNEVTVWPWTARFEAPAEVRAEAGIDVRGVLVLIALVASIGVALSMVIAKMDVLVTDTVGPNTPLGRGLQNVLSPGTMVLAVVAIFLIVRARKG